MTRFETISPGRLRRSVGRRDAPRRAVGIVVAIVGFFFASEASASTYGVHECINEVGAADAGFEGMASGYVHSSSCGSAGFLEVRSGGAVSPGLNKSWALTAPTGTRINRAFGDLGLQGDSNPNGNLAYLFVRQPGGADQIRLKASTTSTFGPYDSFLNGAGVIDRIGIGMSCTNSGAQGNCNTRLDMFAQLRNIGLEMEDTVAPATPALTGPALTGWVRGTVQLGYIASDVGAGINAGATEVNGQIVDFDGFCSPATDSSGFVTRMQPCPGSGNGSTTLKLTEAPFREGVNQVRACAAEYGSNAQVTCKSESVSVDNLAPQVAFTDGQDPLDPDKLIAPVSDATSGVVSGEISYRPDGGEWVALATRLEGDHLEARVDSARLDPGVRYDFRATAVDRAGNAATTSLRANGSQMSVVGPLRTITDVVQLRVNGSPRASVAYTKSGVITGRLVGQDGAAIGGAPVNVRQEFAAGARNKGETVSAETRLDGRFRAVLPAGPSRSITARYAGDLRYLGSHSGEVKLGVRAKVGLAVRPRVRAGRAVAFSGKLKARGAKLPRAGKRLEIQVKVGPKWKTVGRSTTTDRKGTYRLNYRFIAAYERPTRFTFRTIVQRERSWPYLTASSKKRQVVVYP